MRTALIAFFTVVAVSLISVQPTLALNTTIESSVEVENPSAPPTQTIIRITGPDRVVYRLQAPETEVERITRVIREEPRTVISFNGEVTELGGTKVFRVNDWKRVETTTKTTRSDDMGRVVEERTESRSETVR